MYERPVADLRAEQIQKAPPSALLFSPQTRARVHFL